MAKFKIGDKLRRIKNNSPNGKIKLGDIVTVKRENKSIIAVGEIINGIYLSFFFEKIGTGNPNSDIILK